MCAPTGLNTAPTVLAIVGPEVDPLCVQMGVAVDSFGGYGDRNVTIAGHQVWLGRTTRVKFTCQVHM